jgi:cytochrome P450
VGEAAPRRELPKASLFEGARFTLQAMAPNLLQGLFRRRRRAVAAAVRLNADGQAAGVIDGIRRAHGPGPVWVRAGGDQMLLVTDTADIRRVLEGSPDPFAPDPDAKRRGMGHFQPHALTLSRGEEWRNRRRFTEAVLETGRAVHTLGDAFLAVVADEVAALRAGGDELDFDRFWLAGRRIARRIILGDAAAGDEELTDLLGEMMDAANGLPGQPAERLDEFTERIRRYIDEAEAGSLVSAFAGAPSDETTKVDGQAAHWMFALGDTTPANVFRGLALLASHPRQRELVEAEIAAAGGPPQDAAAVASLEYLGACLHEAMRLWPTTPMLSRESVEKTDWEGATVPPGSQLLIPNTFNHRDRERHQFADRFAPEAWTDGDAGSDWSFNHLSHGPQGCPGSDIVLFVGRALIAHLIAGRELELLAPELDPGKPLPRMLDYFAIKVQIR